MAEPASSPIESAGFENYELWALAFLLGAVYLSLFYEIIPPLRYLKYSALPVLILLYIGSLKDIRHPVIFVKPYTLPFLILLSGYAVFLPRINFFGIKDILFISCYLAYFTFFRDRKINARILNLALLAVFALLVVWRERTQSFSLLDSSALAETSLSMAFGLFAVFALVKRRYVWFLINVVALLLSLKRIALLGVVTVLVVLMLPRRLQRIVTSPVVACVFNILALGILLALGSGVINDFFMDRYSFPISGLVMGRDSIYSQVSQHFLADPLMISIFGAGPGSAYDTLVVFVNLHSDMLKIFYELGAVWFIAFVVALYAVSDLRLRLLALFLNVSFLTDNPLIYVDVMVFYMILASQLSLPDSPDASYTKMRQSNVAPSDKNGLLKEPG